MENPKTKTKVVHSKTKSAWNVVGITAGKKFKIARLPYPENVEREKEEALQHAIFISYCFNNSDSICHSFNEN